MGAGSPRQAATVAAMRSMTSSVSSPCTRLIMVASLRASMNSTSPLRFLLLAKNHRQAGICVLKNSWPGRAIITSTTSASTMAARIWPSLFWLLLMLPFAKTIPARPVGLRW
ncbi:hypothetical protein D3C72_2023200 [compost metagenome]